MQPSWGAPRGGRSTLRTLNVVAVDRRPQMVVSLPLTKYPVHPFINAKTYTASRRGERSSDAFLSYAGGMNSRSRRATESSCTAALRGRPSVSRLIELDAKRAFAVAADPRFHYRSEERRVGTEVT